MSVQLSPTVWITWDNSCVERESTRDPLFSKVTRMLRVSQMELHMDENGDWFIKCNCGGRENVGIPCACFFQIAENAGVPEMHIVHLCMISPKYLRCWQTDYATDSRTGELLYEAQRQSFIDKDKGTRLSLVVSDLLRKAATESGEFPSLGPDTLLANYEEALFMMGRSTCTVSDIERFRNPSADSATCGLGSTDDNPGERLSSSDIDVFR